MDEDFMLRYQIVTHFPLYIARTCTLYYTLGEKYKHHRRGKCESDPTGTRELRTEVQSTNRVDAARIHIKCECIHE